MNRNLFGLSLLIILIGIASGLYLLAIIGFVILIPALLAPTRIPTRPLPSTARRETRRIIPPPVARQPESVLERPQERPAVTPAVMPTPSPSGQSPTFSPALFPNSIFPSHSQVSGYPQPSTPTPPAKPAERDELLEIGAILAFLKITFG